MYTDDTDLTRKLKGGKNIIIFKPLTDLFVAGPLKEFSEIN